MVKRTLLVLGILALMIASVGTASAQSWVSGFPGDCGSTCSPLYVPAPCPEYPTSKTIVKTWSCKIEGPCPPPGAPAGCCDKGDRSGNMLGSLLFLAGSIATPFDFLFGGFDGVYGCFPGTGALGLGCSGPCGPCYGPIPGAVAGVLSAMSPPSAVMFGGCW
jgi:hypothetical protein